MLVRFFYRFLFVLVPVWYTVTLNVTRLRRWPPLPRFYTDREIAEELAWGEHWRPDPWRGYLDVVMDPRKMQARIDAGETRLGDCDDHAMYWATALLQSGLCERAWIGTVWYGKGGHAVCVFQRNGQEWWTDYGLPGAILAPWGWAYEAAIERDKQAVCAGMVEVKLRPNGAPRVCWFRGRRSTAAL